MPHRAALRLGLLALAAAAVLPALPLAGETAPPAAPAAATTAFSVVTIDQEQAAGRNPLWQGVGGGL